jgi:hypothetical protein
VGPACPRSMREAAGVRQPGETCYSALFFLRFCLFNCCSCQQKILRCGLLGHILFVIYFLTLHRQSAWNTREADVWDPYVLTMPDSIHIGCIFKTKISSMDHSF